MRLTKNLALRMLDANSSCQAIVPMQCNGLTQLWFINFHNKKEQYKIVTIYYSGQIRNSLKCKISNIYSEILSQI